MTISSFLFLKKPLFKRGGGGMFCYAKHAIHKSQRRDQSMMYSTLQGPQVTQVRGHNNWKWNNCGGEMLAENWKWGFMLTLHMCFKKGIRRQKRLMEIYFLRVDLENKPLQLFLASSAVLSNIIIKTII